MLLTEPSTELDTRTIVSPNILNDYNGWRWHEYFNRVDLNPTDHIELWRATINGTGTVAINADQTLKLNTSAGLGDYCEATYMPAGDRKSTRLNSSHSQQSRMPSSA